MHKFAACDKHKIQITNRFPAVAYGTYNACTVLHEVQFIHFVAVRRVFKVRLYALAYIENIEGFKAGNFGE